MTRGNQRDLARLKNAKKQEALKKTQGAGGKDGANLDNRMARDADIMRQKQEAAAAKKAEEDKAAGSSKKAQHYDPLKP